MASTRTLEVVIAGDASGAKKAFDQTERDAQSFGSKLKGHLSGAAVAVGVASVAAVAGVAYALKGAFDAAEESAKISRETERVIKTTGGAAKVTADQVGDLAAKISNLTGVDDELIQAGENLLLTFTNVRNETGKGNDIFDQATKLALDMSTALGTDMNGASIQLGKALNDPIKGITALSRAGVSFTEDQKNQIKWLVKSGDTLGAQKIVLAELSKEFGGAAEAAASPFDRLKVMIGNFQEQVGAYLIPIALKVADVLGKALPAAIDYLSTLWVWFTDGFKNGAENSFNGVADTVATLGARIGDVFFWIKDFVLDTVLPKLQDGFKFFTTNILPKLQEAWTTVFGKIEDGIGWLSTHREFLVGFGIAISGAFLMWAASATVAAVASAAAAAVPLLIVAAIGVLVGAVLYAYNHWEWFHNLVTSTVEWVTTNVPPAWEAVKNAVSAVVDWLVNTAWPVIYQFYEYHKNAIMVLVNFVQDHWNQISAIISSAWDMIKGIVSNGWQIVHNLFELGYNILHMKWGDAWKNVVGILTGAWDQMKSVVSNGWDILKNSFLIFGGWVKDNAWRLWDGVVAGFKNAINTVIGMWNGLRIKTPDIPGTNFGGQTIDFPDIPKLHSGGVFHAPAGGGGEGLALLRDGERVLTPEQQAGGGGQTIIVQGHLVLEKDLMRIMAQAQASGYRSPYVTAS